MATYKIEVEREAESGKLKFQHGNVSVNTTCWWALNNKIDAGSYTSSATWMSSKPESDGQPCPWKGNAKYRPGIWFGMGVKSNNGSKINNQIFIHKGTSAAWSEGCIVCAASEVLKIWNAITPKDEKNVTVVIKDKVLPIRYELQKPKIVAIAQDKYLKPRIPFADKTNLGNENIPKYGQDITSGARLVVPQNKNVGSKPMELKSKMKKLLDVFASGDQTGMARSLFTAFLDKQEDVIYFDNASLNSIASRHENIIAFCNLALSAPNSPQKTVGKVRIHQALKNAKWDINKINVIKDLGVPAFNEGSKIFRTRDFNNGLGLMINGVQYVYIIATHYSYDESKNSYELKLKFIFYDVFGLDDDDLNEFGALSDGIFSSNASVGITAWWQLQHQHEYKPLVTRIVIEKTYEVPAI